MSERLHPDEWSQLKQKALERDNHECVNCGSQTQVEAHHIVPKENGGKDKLSNVASLCIDCHKKTHAMKVKNNAGSIDARHTSDSVVTPKTAIDGYHTVRHPLTNAIISLHLLYGVGVGELCNIKKQDVKIDKENATINITSQGEHSITRSRVSNTTLPLIGPALTAIEEYDMIRPDGWTDNYFLSTNDWGRPLNLKMVNHRVKKSGLTPMNYILTFRRHMPIERDVKVYLMTGDSSHIDSMEQVRKQYENDAQILIEQL